MTNFNESQPTTQTLPNSLGGGTTVATGLQNLNQAIQGCTEDSALKSGKGSKKPKLKSCKVCRTKFEPTRAMQAVCGLGCALTLALGKRKRLEAKERRETAKADRVKREKLKTKGEYIKEAQAVFNRYIRLRDAGLPCICCGQPMGENVPGGAVDAGHYRSRGSAPHLRFDERNVHAQRKQCNRFDSGNVLGFRFGLRQRIGIEALEELEADQTSRNYTIDDLKNIKAIYTAKCKELEKSIV